MGIAILPFKKISLITFAIILHILKSSFFPKILKKVQLVMHQVMLELTIKACQIQSVLYRHWRVKEQEIIK